MARLRQQHPQSYVSSGNINTEFENLIRYLNAAELGSKTLAELMSTLFNDDGEFDGPIEMRYDTVKGLQYRIGEYDDLEQGWLQLAGVADLRGPAGQNVGTIEGPFFYNRVDTQPASGANSVAYVMDATTDDIVVYKNGILLAEADYTPDFSADTIAFTTPFNGTDKVTIYCIRKQSVSNYRRVDFVASAGQALFPFPHDPQERLMVFRNGILQRYGGSYDFLNDPGSGSIVFTTSLVAGEVVTVMTVENLSQKRVAGMMFEDEYTNANGYIVWDSIAVEDGEISVAKVAGLQPFMAAGVRMTVSNVTPINATTNDLWLNSAVVPNQLNFWDGSRWIPTSPESSLPPFATSNANQYLRVNGTGTAMEWGNIDFSSLVPKTWRGAANGVASLDSDGKLPVNQLPEIFATQMIPFWLNGTVSNGTYLVQRLFKTSVRIDGISVKLAAGTCNVQLAVDGVTVGSVTAVSTTANDVTFNPVIEINGVNASRRLEVVVTSATSATGLEISLAAATVSA